MRLLKVALATGLYKKHKASLCTLFLEGLSLCAGLMAFGVVEWKASGYGSVQNFSGIFKKS